MRTLFIKFCYAKIYNEWFDNKAPGVNMEIWCLAVGMAILN